MVFELLGTYGFCHFLVDYHLMEIDCFSVFVRVFDVSCAIREVV